MITVSKSSIIPQGFGEGQRQLKWVHRTSLDYTDFIESLKEMAVIDSGSVKQLRRSVCIKCWGFLTQFERDHHLEHERFVLPPGTIDSEETFLSLAGIHGKSKDGDVVALLNTRCVFKYPTEDIDEDSLQFKT